MLSKEEIKKILSNVVEIQDILIKIDQINENQIKEEDIPGLFLFLFD